MGPRLKHVRGSLTAGLVVLAVAITMGTPDATAKAPTATSGHRVRLVARGLGTATAFAFGDGAVFASGSNNSEVRKTPGGVFELVRGRARRLTGSPRSAYGLAWHDGTLYVSAGYNLLAWSGWNGSRFTHQRSIYVAPNGFTAFNGIGFGADGRLYAGVNSGNFDHTFSAGVPYLFEILSLTPAGTDLRVVASGIRQPWQMVFPRGSSSPFVSDLGQDGDAVNPPDFILRVSQGQNYGFPGCNWTSSSACSGNARPFTMLAPHTDPMGVGIIGARLYVAEYGNPPNLPGKVVSMPLPGGTAKTVVSGFVSQIVALGTHAGQLYIGELNGDVFRVKP